MYCKYDAPHPLTLPSDWSSEDWNGDKAKAREQCYLLDFDKLEQQLTQTLQNSAQNTSLETLHSKMPDKKLTDDFQTMALKEGKNRLTYQTNRQTSQKHQMTTRRKRKVDTNHLHQNS